MEWFGLIYCAKNKINGKVYVGQTTKSLAYRKGSHLRAARGSRLQCRKFHLAIKKYGPENFDWYVLTECNSQDELDLAEIKFITLLKTINIEHGYNIAEGGKAGSRMSEESKLRLSESRKGDKSPWFGRKHTEETKIKISFAQKGRKGKPHTEESKEKLRQKMLGNCISAEARAKIVAKKTGFRHTEESKMKMSLSRKKSYDSFEYKEKMKSLAVSRGQNTEICKKIAIAKGAKPFAAYKENVFIKEFFSINGASVELGLSCAGIRKVLKGKTKACKGYVFRYIV